MAREHLYCGNWAAKLSRWSRTTADVEMGVQSGMGCANPEEEEVPTILCFTYFKVLFVYPLVSLTIDGHRKDIKINIR